MMKSMTLAAVFTMALLSGGCAEMRSWTASDGTGATGGSYATSNGESGLADPAASATYGTGSASGNDHQQQEAFSSGEGLD
jgi:hypothetical protein